MLAADRAKSSRRVRAARLRENPPVAPGEAKLAVERDDAVLLVGRQVSPRLPGALQERPEPLDGLRLLTGNFALEVEQDASLLALCLERDAR